MFPSQINQGNFSALGWLPTKTFLPLGCRGLFAIVKEFEFKFSKNYTSQTKYIDKKEITFAATIIHTYL